MTEAAQTEAPKKTRGPGVGSRAKELIRQGLTNEEVLAQIKEEFPEAKTSPSSVNWYRNKMRGDGEEVPTARELKKKAKAAGADDDADGGKDADGSEGDEDSDF